MDFIRRAAFIVMVIAPFCALSQTEEDKKEMKGLIDRLQKGEAKQQVVVVKLEAQKKEKVAAEGRFYENLEKLRAIEAVKPQWDSVTHYTDENGNIVDKKFHPKPASVVQWEAKMTAAVEKQYSIGAELEKIEKDIDSGEKDKTAAEEEIKQAKRLIQLKENYFRVLKMIFPDNCGTSPPPESNALAIKAYWDCVFDGVPINQKQLDENNLKQGTNFFGTDVVVPEYNKKAREEKEKNIEEMIRKSTAPVIKPIIIPPPSPDIPKPEPSATERLKNALKYFLPKPPERHSTSAAPRG